MLSVESRNILPSHVVLCYGTVRGSNRDFYIYKWHRQRLYDIHRTRSLQAYALIWFTYFWCRVYDIFIIFLLFIWYLLRKISHFIFKRSMSRLEVERKRNVCHLTMKWDSTNTKNSQPEQLPNKDQIKTEVFNFWGKKTTMNLKLLKEEWHYWVTFSHCTNRCDFN